MPFAAILDASVLYPLPLRDTLLRVAEIELYDPYWSERILAEVTRNLILDRRSTTCSSVSQLPCPASRRHYAPTAKGPCGSAAVRCKGITPT